MHAAGEPVQDLLAKLQGQAKDRMLRAYAPKSKGTLASAIRKFARFAQHVESRVLFQMSAVFARAYSFYRYLAPAIP